MTHVATLISDPAKPALDDAAIALAVGVLTTTQDMRVLDPGIAVDLPFTPSGADDQLLDPTQATELADTIVDSHLVRYERTGHFVLWERPERVARGSRAESARVAGAKPSLRAVRSGICRAYHASPQHLTAQKRVGS